MKDIKIEPAKGISYFTPAQQTPAGTAANPQTSGKAIPKLFQPITIRGLTFQNRLGVSPICQYSAEDGHMTDYHLAHLGGIAQRGPGLIMIEATAVQPEGRISPQDVGLWKDSQIAPIARVIEFAHSQGQKIGIQLAHAGRKASTTAPWMMNHGNVATENVGGWPHNAKGPTMSKDDIREFKEAWAAAAKRALVAGADFIEIHNAHGYLLASFLTPYANKRTDEYSGSFENRTRLPLEIAQLTRNTVGEHVPVFLRLSASDWLDSDFGETWGLQDAVKFAEALVAQGAIDLIDVSSGGLHSSQKVKAGPGFQAPFGIAVKKAVGERILLATVGHIKDGRLANRLLEEEGLDVILVGRGFQKDPGLVWTFAQHLDVEIAMPGQIRWGFSKRGAVYKPSL
ncbi:NADH:flavin oxidoreductase/NADH oxidase [Aspergillus neoniger CBS 115656]|uniref:NADH-dependent flavin oxidoreductase n=1 Tax=Aspergillus neoniger (strain CBS 115656) TaxID=1448310 RepID=A0A318YJJ8_ASPNB|nr:NADH-dependent flavin oxidoreductase [Aspergillus neoniger CBS 115656]PYH32660.1 NADH-dependent flavin oxidoreductase [Aspergillus neoniger CBS 115656]